MLPKKSYSYHFNVASLRRRGKLLRQDVSQAENAPLLPVRRQGLHPVYIIPTAIPNPTRVAPSDRGLERHGGGWGCGRERTYDVDTILDGDWVVCLVLSASVTYLKRPV